MVVVAWWMMIGWFCSRCCIWWGYSKERARVREGMCICAGRIRACVYTGHCGVVWRNKVWGHRLADVCTYTASSFLFFSFASSTATKRMYSNWNDVPKGVLLVSIMNNDNNKGSKKKEKLWWWVGCHACISSLFSLSLSLSLSIATCKPVTQKYLESFVLPIATNAGYPSAA